MSLSRSPIWTHRPGSPNSAVDWRMFSSHRMLSLCSIGTRVGLIFQGCGALELLPGPEFHRCQPERQPLGRDRQAGVHQKPADGVHPEAAGFVLAAVDPASQADPLGALSLVRELR